MIAEPLGILLLAVAASASPPATPDDCRADITTAYTRLTLVDLTRQIDIVAERVRALPAEDLEVMREVLWDIAGADEYQRKRSIDRCIADSWSSSVTSCYLAVDSWTAMEACNRGLPQEKCLRLEYATRTIDHDPMGRCGEPARGFIHHPLRLRDPH